VKRTIRTATKSRLQRLLQDSPTLYDVQVLWGDETGAPDREHIRLGDVTGTLNIPVMSAGRRYRDDRYALNLYVYVGIPGLSPQEAEERCEELCHVIGDVLADDFSLDNLDGLVSAELGEFAGPVSYASSEGAVAWAGPLRIACHSRLQGGTT